MTPSARLQAAIELLGLMESEPCPADAVAGGYFRSRRYIGAKDRAAIAAMTYDILRHHARLGWWIEKLGAEPSPRAKMLSYLALVGKMSPEEISQLFSGKKFAPPAPGMEEGVFLKKLRGRTIDHPDMPEAVAVECPPWAEPKLRGLFGESFRAEMEAMLRPASLDLRVNTLKTSRGEILAELEKRGLSARACRFSPYGVRVESRPNLGSMRLLREGLAEVQDEGSQIVSMLVDARPGMRVADFCAGAGGKTLALAAHMQGKGRIVACDVIPGRLMRSAERFRRAGAHNIETKLLRDENDPWIKRRKESFDRVLADVPCSGTGTWRRNPDQRWRTWGQGLKEICALQGRILNAAARLVKPGGRLIYATCSLLPEENERQIETFLSTHEEFSLLPLEKVCPQAPYASGLYLSLSPYRHGTDGFFAAVMEKRRLAAIEP